MNKNNTFFVPSDDLYITPNLKPGQLPEQLERAIGVTDITTQQDMILLGTLTMMSYATPRIRILHGNPQHAYYPNLMTLVVAPPAAGKGILNYTRRLIQPIHDMLARKGLIAAIPGNTSSAAFIDLLAQNGGKGVMFETEMDVLSQIWKQDYGNYSYLFRQTFEHETVSRSRKGRGGETLYIEVPEPRLSVLLSGTVSQLKPLLGNRENGLASRFMPYLVEDIVPFDPRAFEHGDLKLENSAMAVFDELGKDLLSRWKWLCEQEHDIRWSLTDEQAAIMADLFDDGYKMAFEGMQLPISFDPAFKRLAVTVKRIGAVLSLLRMDIDSKELSLPEVMYCGEEDFRTLVTLAEKLLRHAALMTLLLPEEDEILPAEMVDGLAERHAKELLEKLGDTFTTQEALEKGETLEMKRTTVMDHLSMCCQNKVIKKLGRGRYCKL